MFTIVSMEEQVFDVTTNHSIDHRVHCVDRAGGGERNSPSLDTVMNYSALGYRSMGILV